jgi:hypothetical protein
MTRCLTTAAVLAITGKLALAGPPATVGQLLESGGKELTGSEIRSLFAGATIVGPALGQLGAQFRVTYRPDGTAAGEVATSGGSTKLSGTWSANQNNQYCQNLHTAQGLPIFGCFYFFMLRGQLFMASGNSRSTPVSERQVTR